jgi:WD40 repeat protein
MTFRNEPGTTRFVRPGTTFGFRRIRAARTTLLLIAFLFFGAGFTSADDRHVGPVVDFARVGPVLYSVSQGGVFIHEGGKTRLVHQPEFRVFGMAAVPGGDSKTDYLLLAGGTPGESGRVAWLNIRSGKSASLKVAKDVIYDVAVRPDGREAALACADNRVLTLQLKWFDMMPPILRHKHTSDARAVAYSTDGQWLASGGLDGVILLSSKANKMEPNVLQEHTAGVESLAFSPDGKHLASGSRDARVRLHTADGTFVRTYSGLGMELMKSGLGKKPYIWALAWGGGKKGLIAGSSRGRLDRLSSNDSTWEKLDWTSEKPIYSLAVDAGGRLVVGAEAVTRLDSKLK